MVHRLDSRLTTAHSLSSIGVCHAFGRTTRNLTAASARTIVRTIKRMDRDLIKIEPTTSALNHHSRRNSLLTVHTL